MVKNISFFTFLIVVVVLFAINANKLNQSYFSNYYAYIFDFNYPQTSHTADTIIIKENVYLNLEGTSKHIGNYYAWWSTPQLNVSTDTVIKHYRNGEFRKWRHSRFGQWYNTKHYWFYFVMHNESKSKEPLILGCETKGATLTLFQVTDSDNCVLIDSSDSHTPIHKRLFYDRNISFPLVLEPNSTVKYLLKVQKTTKSNLILPLTLRHAINRIDYIGNDSYYHFAILGFFSFMIILSMSLYFIFYERIYLYQSLYITTMLLFLCYYLSLDAMLMPEWMFVAHSYFDPIIYATIGTYLFAAIFLELIDVKSISPKSYVMLQFTMRANLFIIPLSFISSMLYFFLPSHIYLSFNVLAQIPILLFLFVFFIVFIIITIKLYNQVQPAIKVYMACITVCLVLWLVQMTNYIGFTNYNFIFHSNLFISVTIEIAVFTFITLNKFSSERREKITLLQLQLDNQHALTSSVIEAQEGERKRIAQELHDGLGGFLSALRVMVNKKKNSFAEMGSTAPAEVLTEVQQKLDAAINDVREISHNLMPSDFESKDFSDIIKEHITYLNENDKIIIEYYIDEKINLFPKPLLISLYRILLELIRNIQKHADATKVTIQLIVHPDGIQLQVEDNGNGMVETKGNGIGLLSIQSRVQYHKGKLTIDSGKLGTTFIIEIPNDYAQF